MSRVLFVVKEMKMEHLGVMYLIDSLRRAGHDAQMARFDSPPDPVEVARGFQPDFVAYSVCSGLEPFYFAVDARIAEAAPRSWVLFGGPSATFSPERYLDYSLESNRVVFVVRGEGEESVVAAVERRGYEQLKLVDIKNLPIPDRSEMYKYADLRDNPIKNIITRRGCNFSCSYCFNREWNKLHKGQLPKGVIRYRTVDDVIEEALRLKSSYPLELVNFVDDNFARNREWLVEFAEEWWKRVKLPFFCSVRPDDVTIEEVDLLASAGCKIANMAVEAANEENRLQILGRTGDKERAVAAIEMFHFRGVRTRLQNIIGLPVPHPYADAVETLRFNLRARPTSSWCALLQAYRGTKVHEIASEGGYVDGENDMTDPEFFGHSTLKIRDKRKIERLHKLWPVLTAFPRLNWLRWLLVRLPLPYRVFKWFFAKTKRWLAERDLWQVNFKKEA